MMAFRLVVRQVFSTNDGPDQNGCGRQETNGPTVRMLVRMIVAIVGGAPGGTRAGAEPVWSARSTR